MKLVYLGSGEFGISCLNALYNSKHSLDFIVTQPARPAGRGKKTTPTAVAKWAMEHPISYIETDNINADSTIEQISKVKPELIVVIAFGQKIGNEVINIAPKKAINVHSSLLPKYRGAAPINWAVINGEKETGISIITLAEKMDAGDILGQVKTSVGENENAGELHDRLAKMAAPLLLETIDKIENSTACYVKQDDSKATLAPKLKKSDGYIDFTVPAEKVKRKILGMTPWPGASCLYLSQNNPEAERVTILFAEVVECSNLDELKCGEVDKNLNIICGEDTLKIIKIQPAGKAVMEFKDFVNGRQTRAGDKFIRIDG